MKNNKILYILTLIITLFSLNTNVYAAQELTCIYNKSESGKIILAQNAKGDLKLFINNDDVNITDDGWRDAFKFGYKINFDNITDGTTLDTSKQLTQCPNAYTHTGKKIYFRSANEFATNQVSLFGRMPGYNEPILYEADTENGSNEKCENIPKKAISDFDENSYLASCVYSRDTDEGCHIVQLNIKETGEVHIEQAEPFGCDRITCGFNPEFNTINVNVIKDTYEGYCPNEIFVNRFVSKITDDSTFYVPKITRIDTWVRLENIKNDYLVYMKNEGYGKNLVDKNNNQTNDRNDNINIIGNKIDILSCEEIFSGEAGEKLLDVLHLLVTLVKMAIPLLLIGLGTMDFAKVVFSGANDAMKKTQSKFIKRIIIAACIYLVPTLITFILKIASSIWPNISADFCGIL